VLLGDVQQSKTGKSLNDCEGSLFPELATERDCWLCVSKKKLRVAPCLCRLEHDKSGHGDTSSDGTADEPKDSAVSTIDRVSPALVVEIVEDR
jgi:hypothetical protein